MLTPEQKNELVAYVKERYKYLNRCATSVEGFFEKKYKDCALQSKNGKLTPEIQKVYDDIEANRRTFRYCFLVAVCSYVEDILKTIGKLIVVNYLKKIKKEPQNISNFQKQIKVLESDGKINFNSIRSDISLFDDIIIVRNSIIHNWGNVEISSNKSKLKSMKYNWINTTKDYLCLTDEALPTARITAMNIMHHILKNTK